MAQTLQQDSPLARPVPPETLAEEPPRNAEGMLIGWPIERDPDGPELEPMQPASVWDERRQLEELLRDEDRYERDAALVRALRFT
jgi:hypothetical protein